MQATSVKNVDIQVARGFGREWSTFRQDESSLARHLLPPRGGTGADIGCGTGRWAMIVAPRVAHLQVIDVSPDALAVARENLKGCRNVSFHESSVADIPLPNRSLDFAFSPGVLHHVPDTRAVIDAILKSSRGRPD
jgi:ubiquinone/menaquinone biosynthesis C-methylase UbiE